MAENHIYLMSAFAFSYFSFHTFSCCRGRKGRIFLSIFFSLNVIKCVAMAISFVYWIFIFRNYTFSVQGAELRVVRKVVVNPIKTEKQRLQDIAH